jgi:hypothetical protein
MTRLKDTHDDNTPSQSHTYKACWTYVYGDDDKGFEVGLGTYATREANPRCRLVLSGTPKRARLSCGVLKIASCSSMVT